MKKEALRRLGPSLAAILAVLSFAKAQPIDRGHPPSPAREWREYLGGPDRNHYSPLSQISRANIRSLQKAWEFHTGEPGEMECNPIVVDGVLYAPTTSGRVVALDAASGRLLWRSSNPDNLQDRNHHRGLAYWTDGRDRRILGSVGGWLYALDARTGKSIPEFGFNGRASLKAGLGPQAQEKLAEATTPGTIFGDFIIMPLMCTETTDAAPGYIQAFNVRTGTLAWTFRTIPYPGEPGYETWSKDSYKNSDVGAANCWPGMSIDRKRGILYAPTGSAAPDFWGGHRIGQNLFANCLLALDARTGKLLWYYQFVHHDIWDLDLPAPPNLVTLRRNGRTVDAVAQITKSAHVFVFDRVSGEPLFPIEEVPAPRSELAGEEAWPTQPVPVKPAPFARQAMTEEDISPYAENREALLAILRQAHKRPFEPFSKTPTLILPDFTGGGEWGGAAVDPEGILYVNANEMPYVPFMSDTETASDMARMPPGQRLYTQRCASCHGLERKGLPGGVFPSLVDIGRRKTREEIVGQITKGKGMMPGFPGISAGERESVVSFLLGEEKGAGAAEARAEPQDRPSEPYRFNGQLRFLDSNGYPAMRPPWGSLTAIDLNTGEHRWRITLGELKEFTARGIPPTGAENFGGPMATAGGLLFIAATKDGMFRVFDSRTGERLWETELPAGGYATPSTYEVSGKQYVVIACGGEKMGTRPGDSLVAFALP